MRVRELIASALLALTPFAAAAAQENGATGAIDVEAVRAAKRVAAVRVDEPIVVDGTLDEPMWRQAAPATDFLQQIPDEYQPASERTEVRFLYDDESLYVGAVMFDPDPDRLVVNELRRDFQGFQNDVFTLVLDTFSDRRNSYGFMVNAGGAQRDVQAFENGRSNDANWNGVWFVRTQIGADRWTLEMSIPFKTLRFPDTDVQQWGLNVMRIVRRTYEFSTWAPVPRQLSHYAAGYAGTLSGISGVRRGRDLRVTPFATAAFNGRSSGAWRRDGDGGVDVKWGLTSSLLLDASLRTDFSQVEADEQQINLTRFSLFFPEKRQFFLENPANFQVGLAATEDERRDLVPFFSRRIGLSSTGQPIPVIGGLRLTGRAGRNAIGLLTVQTDDFEGTPGANFSVLRMTRDLTPTSSLGAFYFGREAGSGQPAAGSAGSYNRVGGIDFRLTPSRTLEIEAFAMRSETLGREDDWAGRTGLRWDANAHRARLGLVHIGDAFRHDLGFVRRRGVGSVFGAYERVLRPAHASALFREHTLRVDTDLTSTSGYDRFLTRVGGAAYELSFRDGSSFNARVTRTAERLNEPFMVASGLTIAPGSYTYDTWRTWYQSDRSAVMSGDASIEAGEFWTGTQRIAGGGLRVRLNEHVAASASLSRNTIDLPQGSFAATLARLRLDWSFSPRMFLNAFVQYNGQSDSWLTNIRYNLIHRPLSDIYVVWNETRLPGETRRALMLKYTHLIAF
ncbi:MAG: carbohydrate binding family 9 domain-containing protein [Acidimicrobiia bacterium]|nr:carbohydrate binding family 9 domain-containing protein [Acidimicrobiia bacterium]